MPHRTHSHAPFCKKAKFPIGKLKHIFNIVALKKSIEFKTEMKIRIQQKISR